MRSVDRRRFLRYAIGSAAALGLESTVLGRLQAAYAAGGADLPRVLWLAGGACTGCTVSLANRVSPSRPMDVGDLFLNSIDLVFHTTLMGAAGQLAVDALNEASRSDYILAVEGAVPTAFGGRACLAWTDNGSDVTMMEAVEMLAPGARAILAIGTCASYGGVASASPNPAGGRSVRSLTGLPAISIPGCPTHPDWLVWVIAQLLAGVSPDLDSEGRPTALFARSVHDRCPRKGKGGEAKTFAVEGACLKELGCKGPETRADCPTRLWNDRTNWCVGANAECIGCTSRKFPDGWGSFYKSDVV